MSVFCEALPAAATNSWLAAPAALMASSSACEKPPPPHELLVSRQPMTIEYWMPAIAASVEPDPAELRNLIPAILACQLTPTTPMLLLPVPAIVPEQWEPCPLSSNGSPSLL